MQFIFKHKILTNSRFNGSLFSTPLKINFIPKITFLRFLLRSPLLAHSYLLFSEQYVTDHCTNLPNFISYLVSL